jgi:hypothetical protein
LKRNEEVARIMKERKKEKKSTIFWLHQNNALYVILPLQKTIKISTTNTKQAL